MNGRCVACGGQQLTGHWRVAGRAGPDGLIPTTQAYGTALADVVRCGTCGHMQLERFPNQADLREAYEAAESEAYVAEAAGQRETARRALAHLETVVRPGALLDLGCWTGFLLAEAKERGWEGLGVEPSRFAAAYAREQLDLSVVEADLLDADLGGRRFRAVVMADVLEHLPDPGAALRRVAGLVEPDGAVCLMLPDAGSRVARGLGARWWSVLPTHVQYFTRQSLGVLLERSGYRVSLVTTAPKAFSVDYYLERIAGYAPRLSGGLRRAAARVGVGRRMWAPDFRDRMLVIAQLDCASSSATASSASLTA